MLCGDAERSLKEIVKFMTGKKKTEKELVASQNQNVFLIDKLLRTSEVSPEDIGDMIPGMFHLNRKSDLIVEYLSKPGLAHFGMSLADVHELGATFFDNILSIETKQIIMPRMLDYSINGSSNSLYTDFQFFRRAEGQPYEAHLSSVKLLKGKDLVATVTLPVNSLSQSTNKMERLLGENIFLRKNYAKFATLTKREKEILTLIAKGNSNTEIGDMLFISGNTVRTHRNKIFSKLEIKHISQLIKYAYAFDLI